VTVALDDERSSTASWRGPAVEEKPAPRRRGASSLAAAARAGRRAGAARRGGTKPAAAEPSPRGGPAHGPGRTLRYIQSRRAWIAGGKKGDPPSPKGFLE